MGHPSFTRAIQAGYFDPSAPSSATALSAGHDWFDYCEQHDITYACMEGSAFYADLIAQSFGCNWTLESIGQLFDRLELLCNRQFSLTCASNHFTIRGIKREHREEVASIALGALEACRCPKAEKNGWAIGFTRHHSPSWWQDVKAAERDRIDARLAS